ncbi:MAG: phytanoyl-CoA dioxygenase family protein, partial [Myxococcales bacterium]|nr:phytanoyl-CoA dioxygenase family protein [Myxococcales bacterium]
PWLRPRHPVTVNRDPAAIRFLEDANARSATIHEKWVASNEQWWDWYLSLAHDESPPPAHPLELSPLPEPLASPLHEIERELDEHYPIPAAAIEQFRREGYVKLAQVCSANSLLLLRRELAGLLAGATATPGVQFQSIEMLWTMAPLSRAFVFSRRLGRIAAELLGVDAVRLYHDNVLAKLPGGGRTPWHYDAHHYPIASEAVATLWMPLQPTPREMGPLAFARGIETWRRFASLAFSKFDDSYDRQIGETLRRDAVPVEDGPFELGELSFHHTRCLHTAGPNHTTRARLAFSTTYFEDGARLIDSPTMISGDYEKFVQGTGPGEPIASELNPVLYRAVSC